MTESSDLPLAAGKKKNILVVSYLMVSIWYMISLFLNLDQVIFYLKPCLMLPLIGWVFSSFSYSNRNILLAALIFSWAGDTLLLFSKDNSRFFLLGLCAFLMAHIFYIYLFRKTIQAHPQKSQFNATFLLVAVYGLVLLYFLWPGLHEMKIPVSIYALVICLMLFYAIKTALLLSGNFGIWLILGAISFVLSDSILAVNKFITPFAGAGIMIMGTYLFAQFSITKACLQE